MAVAAAVLAALCISLIIFHLHNLQEMCIRDRSLLISKGITPLM